MFTPTQLKDIQVMIEYYRDKTAEDAAKPITTEAAKRMYAREVLKADEFLSLIRDHVGPFAIEGDESRSLFSYGSNGRSGYVQSI